MRCLIDKTVKHAEVYYKTYGKEPSPAGEIAIAVTDITALDEIDLKTVLTEMKKLGAKGEMVVVTHSNPQGLKMPLIKKGTVSAQIGVVDKIVEISTGISRRAAIDGMPASGQPKAWQKWFKDFDAGIKLEDGYETNPDWKSYVVEMYEKWYERQGKTILGLPDPKKDLADLIGLVDDIRKTGFAKLEFRACRIGTDQDSLKTVANFLNIKKVVAPKEVRTFFGSISKVSIISDADFARRVRATTARKFTNIKILLIPGEHVFEAYATADSEVKTFLKTFISASYTGSITPFVMGGLEPSGKAVIAGKKHVFPLESDYLGLLAMYDAAKSASATGGLP
jgi:hypothetical protein